MSHKSNIERLTLFVEPPLDFVEGSSGEIPPLPNGAHFYQNADDALSLGARLLNYLVDCDTPTPSLIPRLADTDRYQYFAAHSHSERWLVYHCSGKYGWRYSLLIEFVVYPKEKFLDPDLHKTISEEHHTLLIRLAAERFMTDPKATREAVCDYAFEEASRTVGIKWGISKDDLLPIIAEGYEKGWCGNIAFKKDKDNA